MLYSAHNQLDILGFLLQSEKGLPQPGDLFLELNWAND